ncbi:HPr family phosphocarrier protein [Sutcliffiella cohnii]|uniref:PTS sorbose transporter subunit IIC n=1 Tax=Sutcliffiella cohnii TaxID=33932 RepID=A0A223KSM0_9BACI|nr:MULTISPECIES: HPr family phosphocarrier protein [Sutcliffiella]AST92358.1 PTS sorbose transporter subunit IIC [Sutcliffiella cohnii]MED4017179.1 HPr family phosphocarrier protein [Sutcliffiella cohnii]WBL13589.1 HPr family phosphocarrier protein [Sutcliffiella sp. NC1]
MVVTVLKPIFGEAASKVVNTTSSYSGTVLFKKEHWVIDAKSLLGLLALALQPGQEVEITADEGTEVIEALLQLGMFEKKS